MLSGIRLVVVVVVCLLRHCVCARACERMQCVGLCSHGKQDVWCDGRGILMSQQKVKEKPLSAEMCSSVAVSAHSLQITSSPGFVGEMVSSACAVGGAQDEPRTPRTRRQGRRPRSWGQARRTPIACGLRAWLPPPSRLPGLRHVVACAGNFIFYNGTIFHCACVL